MDIQHPSHPDPLIFFEQRNEYCRCFGCGRTIKGALYGCVSCNFFLHKSCAELNQQIQHPFHPSHSLTLITDPTEFQCHACWNKSKGFHYSCQQHHDGCKFKLDLECCSLTPSINWELHEHPLAFFRSINVNVRCELCITFRDAPGFRCVPCQLSFHVECLVPLPESVELGCHSHPLKLTHYNFKEDYADEYYCDACEQEREPWFTIYCCKDCNFIAHLYCGIPEDDLKSTVEKGGFVNSKIAELGREIMANQYEYIALRAKQEEMRKRLQQLEEKRWEHVASTASSSN